MKSLPCPLMRPSSRSHERGSNITIFQLVSMFRLRRSCGTWSSNTPPSALYMEERVNSTRKCGKSQMKLGSLSPPHVEFARQFFLKLSPGLPKTSTGRARRNPGNRPPLPSTLQSRNYIPFLRACHAERLVAFSDADIKFKFLAEALIKLHHQTRY